MLEPLNSVRKADALDLLKRLQGALEGEDVDAAVEHLNRLQKQLQEWQHTEQIIRARAWLDTALAGELLAFNSEQAKQQLTRWRNAIQDDNTAEVEAYEDRVEQQAKRKQEAVHVRGITSHCEDLFQKAAELESGANPPNPDFLIENYYLKAKNIAAAARGEITSSPEIDVLNRKADQLHSNKVSAARVYPMALEDDKYTEALSILDKLPNELMIPRFVVTQEGNLKRGTFSNMIAQDAARTEIRQQAQAWAEREAELLIKAAVQALESHEPEEANDTLDATDRLDPLLTTETRIQLNDVRQRATTALQSKQRAVQLVRQANEMAADDDLAAWEAYTQAQALYQWVDGLPATRKTILEAMRRKLEQMVQQADRAFDERDMERVRELHRQGHTHYAGKDEALGELLAQLDEFNEMTRRYDEYIQTATDIYQQVRELMWEDAVAANDLLTQLESYPDIVLEAFPELYDTRQQVNERLSTDTLYSELYRGLFEQDGGKVRSIIEETQEATEDYPADNRFPVLRDALNMHLYFLRAQDQLQSGQLQEASEALQAVASVSGHPDQAQARQLLTQINADNPPQDA